ncbi:hypothetical protein F350042L8_06890 [Fusobacterium ulcerans]|uniref:hypothetical protein n=1 Tax=Fusobacterium ulcerans TaxID=861 RepID=UPI0034B15473
MIIDSSRLEVIGIDRIMINNFKILNFEKLEKKEIVNKQEYIERFEIKEKGFHLVYSNNLKATGEVYSFSTLEFNANKIKVEHNIYNSSVKEVYECLKTIVLNLKNGGIELDLTEAKIRELEINITFEKDYKDLQEVMLLLIRANHQKALGMYSATDADIPEQIKRDRIIYFNAKLPESRKENTGKVIKIYDKSFELFINQDIFLEQKLTRIEVLFGRDYYRNIMEKIKLDNSLKIFLTNDFLKQIFLEALDYELKVKPLKQIERIKNKLVCDFNSFRRNEKAKRIERNKLKKTGKNIPDHLKEERGVFEYLKKNSWIFDWKFLYEICQKQISSRHRKMYEQQLKKYMDIKNYEKYQELINLIFFTS